MTCRTLRLLRVVARTVGSVAICHAAAANLLAQSAPPLGEYTCVQFSIAFSLQEQFRTHIVSGKSGLELAAGAGVQFLKAPLDVVVEAGNRYTLRGTTGRGTYAYNSRSGALTFTGDANLLKLTKYFVADDRTAVMAFEPSPGLFWQCDNITLRVPRAAATPARAPSTASPASMPAATGSATAQEFSGRFDGSYTCGAAPAALQLEMRAAADGALTAVFTAGGANGTPRLSYSMTGQWSGNRFRLVPGKWIEHPPNWEMVPLSGTLQGGRARGSISYPRCSTFDVTRK
jgi:hypothetical protein